MKNRIRELREAAGLRQGELAALLGVRQNTLSTWETGRYEPDNGMLQKIAEHFNVSTDYVLGFDPPIGIKVPEVDTLSVMNLLRLVERMTARQYKKLYSYAEMLLAGESSSSNSSEEMNGKDAKLVSAYHEANSSIQTAIDALLFPVEESESKSAVS